MANYDIATGFYESASKPLAAQQCIGFYPQVPVTRGAVSQIALFSTPGVSLFSNLIVSSGSRGSVEFLGKAYTVNGTTLFEIDSLGGFVNRGTVTGTGEISMAQNGLIIAIVISGNGDGFFFDPTSGLSQITDPNYLGARTVTFIDGIFVYNTDKALSGRDEIFIGSVTEENKGKNFNALEFGTAEISPDPILSMRNVKNQLYAVGETTIEIFRNAGLEGFPFVRVPGANVDKGTPARFGFTLFDNSYVYLGHAVNEGLAVWRGTSGSPQKISTPAIDNVLLALTDAQIKDVSMFSYAEGGNFFFALILPDRTFFYDASTSSATGLPVWHERKTGSTQWRFVNSLRIFGKTLVFDSTDGKVGFIDTTVATELGDIVQRTAAGAYFSNQGLPIFADRMELIGESGVGGEPGEANNNPQVNLSWSDDGGNTFNDPQPRSMGLKDDFTQRPVWWRMGRIPATRVFKLEWNNDKSFSADAMWLTAEGGI